MINTLIVSVALLAAADAPPAIPAPNEPTEAAKAVYLADAAAKARGDLSQLAVLGTTHLSSLPKDFDRRRFRPLLDRLKAWAPDKIAIESVSGAQCDYLIAYAFAYPDTAKNYCFKTDEARTVLGVTGAEAEARIEKILATPTADRPAEERRTLAGLFFAVGDPASAMVQWLRLPEADRIAGEGLPEALAAALDGRRSRLNENELIAAALAAELGHERVYPVDDHTGDRATGPIADEKSYEQEIMAAWDNEWIKPRREVYEDWQKRIKEDPSTSVLDWYKATNSVEEARLAVAGDFGAQAGAKQANNSGRKYLAYWETRNMRMAANIREVIGPKAKVLAIVGSSHKAYYERYLGVTSDLEIVDIQTILK